MNYRLVVMVAILAGLGGCASNNLGRNLPGGATAYNVIPPVALVAEEYRIGPLDALDITVLQEPELSSKAVPVDASGNVNLTLLGNIKAGGKTAAELSKEIASRYSQRYLKNPQVSVLVAKPVSQKVAVQGEVAQPGIYPIEGPTTLLGAISLAQGETRMAALNDVVVFRMVNGKREGAVFDINQIRNGQAPDPQIRYNDTIIVGFSGARRMWRDVLGAMPILNIFRPF